MNPKLLSNNSQTCVQICVSSHMLLTWRPSSKPSSGTVVGGEPQHPKESEPRQRCLTCCSHLHSFKGYCLYNDIKFKHKILTSYRARAILCYVVLNQSVKSTLVCLSLTKSKFVSGCALCKDKPYHLLGVQLTSLLSRDSLK